ncbi:phosphatase PAP2 family protein [Pseudobdellovibrio exovorus]|uniref:Phosphatase n=1 Tax=Pseudobdellovibrio exovorus JSS TaxID=1184267 RepID=M4VAZ3_9BACT|nr:phosphatase PAP2 family protein [Pseudobdellovibrio exovorus]AGH96547.1 phosphatase [Pseudobdellovibrio exovorus JSS]
MFEFLINTDHNLFTTINSAFTHPWADAFFFWVTDLHKTIYFKILIVPFVVFLFIRKFKLKGLLLFFVLILALGLNDFIGGRVKHVVERERPFSTSGVEAIQRSRAGGYSFPSNHSSNMFTFAAYTSYFIPQAKVPLYLIAASVGYSRVYNGVHFPSDVICGSIFGWLWGNLFARLSQRILQALQNRKKTT